MWRVNLSDHSIVVEGPYKAPNGRVTAMSAAEQERWCKDRGGRLPTAEEFDAIYATADVKVLPHPRDVVKAPFDSLHDDAIAAWKLAGEPPEPKICAGKTWIRHPRQAERGAVNYGWFIPLGDARVAGGVLSWRGIPVHKSVTANAYVIQAPGAAHGPSHVDYSQLGYCVIDVDEKETDPGPTPSGPAKTGSEPRMSATLADGYIPARHFTKGRKALVRLIVLHSTENPPVTGVARKVAQWFGGPAAPNASAHYVVGPEEILQCVLEEDTAWAAPGANHDGIQIEMVGQALQTDWLSGGGLLVVQRTAKLVAALCRAHNLPILRVDAAGLLAGGHGVTTHAAVTKAYKRSTHIDPGGATDSRWPWEEFLQMVRAA